MHIVQYVNLVRVYVLMSIPYIYIYITHHINPNHKCMYFI